MSKIRAKRSQSNWKCAQNWPLRCLLKTEECWTHNVTLFTMNWRMLNTQPFVHCLCTYNFHIFNFLNVTLVFIFYDDVKWLHWCQLGIKTNIWRFPGCFLNDFYILPARKTWKTFPCRSNRFKKSLENVSYFRITNSGCKLTLQ